MKYNKMKSWATKQGKTTHSMVSNCGLSVPHFPSPSGFVCLSLKPVEISSCPCGMAQPPAERGKDRWKVPFVSLL
jgi:hypothetical protein